MQGNWASWLLVNLVHQYIMTGIKNAGESSKTMLFTFKDNSGRFLSRVGSGAGHQPDVLVRTGALSCTACSPWKNKYRCHGVNSLSTPQRRQHPKLCKERVNKERVNKGELRRGPQLWVLSRAEPSWKELGSPWGGPSGAPHRWGGLVSSCSSV